MMASSSSSASSFFSIEPLDGGGESEPYRHAMDDACSLCGRRLAVDRDIFMYRGDTPFCSEECRYRQMVRDEFGGAGGDDMRFKTEERPGPARKEEERRRRRRRHQAPAAAAAAAEPARVPLAANVPVAI